MESFPKLATFIQPKVWHSIPTRRIPQPFPMNPTLSKWGFVLIDDDPISNMICNKLIEKINPQIPIQAFTDPIKGLRHIEQLPENPDLEYYVLLLDINMPIMNGWQFVDRFANLSPDVQQRFRIYILSSSVDKHDISKAQNNPLIHDYLIKPLSPQCIHGILNSISRPEDN